jgi:hypothetical protein
VEDGATWPQSVVAPRSARSEVGLAPWTRRPGQRDAWTDRTVKPVKKMRTRWFLFVVAIGTALAVAISLISRALGVSEGLAELLGPALGPPIAIVLGSKALKD